MRLFFCWYKKIVEGVRLGIKFCFYEKHKSECEHDDKHGYYNGNVDAGNYKAGQTKTMLHECEISTQRQCGQCYGKKQRGHYECRNSCV